MEREIPDGHASEINFVGMPGLHHLHGLHTIGASSPPEQLGRSFPDDHERIGEVRGFPIGHGPTVRRTTL